MQPGVLSSSMASWLVRSALRLVEALDIAHRTRGIAKQSIVVGMGLSLLAMLAAAMGQLPPLAGAILQEVIDVAVIATALRAIGAGRGAAVPPSLGVKALAHIEQEHTVLTPLLARAHDLTERLHLLPADTARTIGKIQRDPWIDHFS